ncbi:hypothetical protein FH972_021126 [Carpinus fangiana]|uniref:Uncharacterized protein n=1 Tax=Carpinus fangiana TaxID=176857 RepID=A0A5N6KQK3_9ROSI|nr:hypothetical protein FH972_021126 [Carpinus fangiana]
MDACNGDCKPPSAAARGEVGRPPKPAGRSRCCSFDCAGVTEVGVACSGAGGAVDCWSSAAFLPLLLLLLDLLDLLRRSSSTATASRARDARLFLVGGFLRCFGTERSGGFDLKRRLRRGSWGCRAIRGQLLRRCRSQVGRANALRQLTVASGWRACRIDEGASGRKGLSGRNVGMRWNDPARDATGHAASVCMGVLGFGGRSSGCNGLLVLATLLDGSFGASTAIYQRRSIRRGCRGIGVGLRRSGRSVGLGDSGVLRRADRMCGGGGWLRGVGRSRGDRGKSRVHGGVASCDDRVSIAYKNGEGGVWRAEGGSDQRMPIAWRQERSLGVEMQRLAQGTDAVRQRGGGGRKRRVADRVGVCVGGGVEGGSLVADSVGHGLLA